jgi:imidazole glycerol-phosphate synthase subunit HisH
VTSIAVLDYGSGNLHSVSRAIDAVGGDPVVTGDPGVLEDAGALVIPGVGHVGACARAIRHRGLDEPVRAFASSGRAVFGVCVGMQVLLDGSEEDPQPCLGVIPGRSRGLVPDAARDVKVPHMGWNTVTWIEPHPYVDGVADGTRFYFVHSYAPDVSPGTTVGVSEHGRPFAAAVARGNVFATQFHPEKSGAAGLAIYERFVKAVAT